MVRLQVVLDTAEANALAQWAGMELRDPRDQIRVVLREELRRRGLLPPDDDMQAGEDARRAAEQHSLPQLGANRQ